tara:strand:- start:2875 stop:4740 length:1866 start_codon:yes stop_codon:yes gene_type:complete
MEITVQSGDTLTTIARDNNSTPVAIAEASGVADVNKIYEGQILTVPDAPIEEEPGFALEGNDSSDEDALVQQLIDAGKVEDIPYNEYDEEGALITGDYTEPSSRSLDIQSAREEAKLILNDQNSTEAEKLAAENLLANVAKPGPNIEPEVLPADRLDQQANREEAKFADMAADKTPAEQAKITEALKRNPRQGPNIGTEKEALVIEPDLTVIDAKPATAAGAVKAIPVEQETTIVKESPPTEDELATLISSLTPLSTSAADVYTKVVKNLQGITFESEFDAKELYEQLAKDAERETKKIDDSIAAIAKEEIKPTFAGFDKFMAVLGAAMGAYASALTGTPNYALNIINKAIDADQKQFLASKEIRTQSLLQQRQSLIQRRGDLLQVGINQADRMLAIAQKQQDNQLQIANIQAVATGLKNEAIKVDNDNKIALAKIFSTKYAAQKVADAAKTKDVTEKTVKSIEVKNGDGELTIVEEFIAATKEEAIKMRTIRTQTKVINNLMDEMENLYINKNNWLPGAVKESTASLTQFYNELKLQVKVIKNMGANFTIPEIKMIDATIPTDSIIDKAKNGLVKINNLRDMYISQQYAAMEAHGYTKMPNAAGKQKRGLGMKIGVAPNG